MTKRILVCDDELEGFERTESLLGDAHRVKGLVSGELKNEMEALFNNVSRLLSENGGSGSTEVDYQGPDVFKDVDVAIVDNNLSALNIQGVRLTAEAMIGYLRAFTNVAYIVSLNKNPDIDFDLRYMVGDHQSHADLALNTEHLSSRVLWHDGLEQRAGSTCTFAPSYWPNLDRVSAVRRDLIRGVEHMLEKPVLDVIGFPKHIPLEALSRRAKGALAPKLSVDSDLWKVTCLQFFCTSCRSLPPKDRATLLKEARRGNLSARSSIARTVAGDLEKWVRRQLLGPQDVLVDLPHLLARMPFLLGDASGNVNVWNRTLSNVGDPLALVSDTSSRRFVEAASFGGHGMYFRWPCFWWHDLRDNGDLNALFFDSEDEWADVVFCEDVSEFCEVAKDEPADDDEADEGVKGFEAEFGGPWARRYIKDLPDKLYSPRSRLAL